MDLKKKGFFFSVCVLLLLVVLAGCTSAPKQPGNPYLGYVYYRAIEGDTNFKQDEVGSQLRKYELEIASLEFKKRQNQFRGIQKERSLEKTKAYIKALERPIVIEKAKWQGALDRSLKKKGKKAAEAYWAANHPISFSGSKALAEWRDALDNVRAQRGADARKAAEAEKEIEDLRRENRYRQALAKVELLRPYKPTEAGALVESVKKEASAYWVEQREAELDGLEAARPYDSAHEQRVMAWFAKVNEDVNAFGHREAFNGVYNGWMALLGENWRTRIVQLGAEKEYWEAYGFVWDRYHEYVDTVRFADTYRKGLKLAINKGYLEILDNAVRYYADMASKNAFKKGHGKAYVYCCMAKQMYDFVTVAGIDYAGEEAEKQYQRITDLVNGELVPALDARVARRLAILDFGLDAEGMASSLREECLERFNTPGNDLAWGLEVVVDKVALAQIEKGDLPIEPEDIVVECANADDIEVKVTQEPPSQRTAFVKTDKVKMVDNPDEFRKDKTSKFYKDKKRWAQEVSLYSLIDTKLSLDLSCDIQVSCRHRRVQETLGLPVTEAAVEQYNTIYGSGTNTDSRLLLPNVSEEMKYYTEDTPRNAILPDKIPHPVKFSLPEEDRVKAALVATIVTDLADELQSLIVRYPVELLEDAALEDPGDYLNTLGTVLYYVAKLSEEEAAKRDSAGFNYEWLHLRDQIDFNMKTWCEFGDRWGDYSGEAKVLKSLWEECIIASKVQDEP